MNIKQEIIDRNITKGRALDPYGHQGKVQYIILHTEDDSVAQTQEGVAAWFEMTQAHASAHYLVGLDGGLIQCVLEADTAWHAANWLVNLQSIGIEHEDNGNPNDAMRTDALYASAAQLVADICKRNNIPCKLVDTVTVYLPNGANGTVKVLYPREPGILMHKQVSLSGTMCPGGLNCNRIVAQASAILAGQIQT
jgi:N-acetylmuramoyl-L-alanine amidase CwlA